MALKLQSGPHGVTFEVRVQPGAPRCALSLDGERLKVRIDAPPVDGEANERLIAYFSKTVFHCPRAAVSVLTGARGRSKVIAVDLPLEVVQAALSAALAD